MLLTLMYLAMTIRTSLKFRTIRNNLRKILTDRYAVIFYTTSSCGATAEGLDSPESSLSANVSSCIWYRPDQRGCLVYPVQRIDLSNWLSIPQRVQKLQASYSCLDLVTDTSGDDSMTLHLTLETTNELTARSDDDLVMLSRFGQFLAWNRTSRGLELLLEVNTSRLFQLIVATFGHSRFHLIGGGLKLVQLETIETIAEPMPFEELERQLNQNKFQQLPKARYADEWLSALTQLPVLQYEPWQSTHATVAMQPDIISSNDIKISLEVAGNGTVVSSQSRTDLLSSGSNSRNRSQLDLTDGIVSSLERDSSASSEDSQTTVHTEVKNGDYIQSPPEELSFEAKPEAAVAVAATQTAYNLQTEAFSPLSPTNGATKEMSETKETEEAKTSTVNVEPPSVANGALKSVVQPLPISQSACGLAAKHTAGASRDKPKGRTLRKSSFPSNRLRLGDGPAGVAPRPPNILVHSDSSSTMEYVIATLNNLLEPNTYTIYPISTAQTLANCWQQTTKLIIVAGTLDVAVRKVLLDYFLHGGIVFSLCSDLLDSILPDSKTAEIRERELVSFSYRKWKQIKMLHHIFCYQLSPAKKQFSLETDEPGSLQPLSFVDVKDMTGKEHSLAVEILAQEETWNTPSILETHNRKTGGRAIFSQIHLELDPSSVQTSIDLPDDTLQSSNELRYAILSDLLGERIGLKLKQSSKEDAAIGYKNAYFLGKHEAKVEVLDALKDTMARPNVIQAQELTLQFCGKSDGAPGPATETHLPVMIFHCPEDFSTLEYFENLTTHKIGRIGIYAPIMSTSMVIVSNLTLAHGFIVIARHQTKGKGRSSNQWLSPPGCAMFSLQLHIPMSSPLGQRLSMVQHLVAVSIVSAILAIPGYEHLDLGLKWPNDIYAYGAAKLGGSIFNTQVDAQTAIVNIGVGLNLSNSKPTVCLNDVIAHYNTKHSTALSLLSYEKTFALMFNKLEELYERVQCRGLEILQQEYYRHWLHQDAEVSMLGPGGESLQGTVVGIDDYGFLLVKKQPSGETVSVHPDGNSFDMMQGLIIPKFS